VRAVYRGVFLGPGSPFHGSVFWSYSAEGGAVDGTPADGTENSGASPLTSRYQVDLRIPQAPGIDFAGPDGTKKFALVRLGRYIRVPSAIWYTVN
jgi:hypothetical protein